MPTYKLIYFNGRGRAETIRLVFAAAGIRYEDKRLEGAEWGALKPKTPFGSLPVLDVDGKMIAQSVAIARYVAREGGLAGKSSCEQAFVDAIADTVTEIREKVIPVAQNKDEAKKTAAVREFCDTTLTPSLTNLEKLLSCNKDGKGFFVGDTMTLADLHFYAVMEMTGGAAVPDPLKSHPKLKALYDRVAASPKIAEYLKKRPATAF